jgi:hypothetical protein
MTRMPYPWGIRINPNSSGSWMATKMMQKPLAALLLATALALLHVPALAQSMTTDGSNATLPAAHTILGLPTNWVQQYHQNGGGSVTGHYLAWGDQNYDILADHFGVQSQDASQATTATLGGSLTVADRIGWQMGASFSYISVHSGDTAAVILNKLAAALQGGALTATIAAGAAGGYTNNDIVTLTGVSANCPVAPAFKLTVSGGSVITATVTGSGGSSVMGGYCTATPIGPFSVSGGAGSGLSLNVNFASPAIATALLAIADANGIGYAATASVNGSNLQFDFPSNATLLTCASGGTGVGCPTPAATETITLNTANLDNGPFGYMSRLVPGRTPQVNDAIGWYRVDGQSGANTGLDTQYAGLKVRIGTVSSSAPEGIASLEGATGGSKGSLPLLSCLGSKGCWVEDGVASNPNQARGSTRGSFAARAFTQITSDSGRIDTFATTAANGYIAIGTSSSTLLVGALGSQTFLQASNALPIQFQTTGGGPTAILANEATTTKTSNYAIPNTDSGQHFDNTGASGEVDFTLPAYSAGLRYCFTVTTAQTLKVIAPASNNIAIGTTNSAAAGNIAASAVYSTACIYATTVSNQWAAKSATGSWTVN